MAARKSSEGWYFRERRRILSGLVCLGQLIGVFALSGAGRELPGEQQPPSPVLSALRPPVHPRRNVDEFPPVEAKFIRFTILRTNRGEPCIDELEVFTAGSGSKNVALAGAGAKATVSGNLLGYRIHKPEHVNDGAYGNGRSWISDQPGRGWIQVEFAAPERINKVVWGRDREGKFIDRLVTEYRIEASLDGTNWQLVASSEDRRPLAMGAEYFGTNPAQRLGVNRFAPVQTTLSQEAAPDAAREYTLRVWQSEDGLPSNTISAILQTRDGYLWIGTFNGLVRFDGVRFVVFGESEGLVNPRVTCLLEDRNGSLWIGTEGGGLMRRSGNRFILYSVRDGLSSDVILSIAEDRQGDVWVGTLSGLNRLREGRIVQTPGQFDSSPIHRILADQRGDLWIFSDVLRILSGDALVRPPFEDEPAGFTSLFSIHEGPSGSLWVGGANGYVARLRDGRVTVFGAEHGLLPDIVWEIIEARNGDVWVGTASGGLSRLRDGRFITLTTQDGLSNNSVRSICEDREGSLWVGTNGGGLIRLRAKTVSTFTAHHGLSHQVIMSMAEDEEGQVWLGSNCGGLNIWRSDRFDSYSITYLLDNECIWSLCAGPEGQLWIGTWGGGLFLKSGDRIVNYLRSDGLSDDIVLALCRDHAGGLWVGTYTGGLNHFADGKFTHYTTRDGLSANTITSILEDAPGKLWIGTSGGGLNRLDQGRFSALRREDGLASDFVRTLYRDREGLLWIGTSGGLSLLKAGKCFSVTARHGLIDPTISQILEDDQGYLWLGSNQGISRVLRQDLIAAACGELDWVAPISFGKEEGMESLECTGGFHPAGLRTSDGRLWFSTVEGVVRVDPRAIMTNAVPPPVVIEEMLANGEVLAIDPSAPSDSPKLGPGLGRLEIRYTALSLAAPGKVRFKYWLEGLEKTWNDAGGRRTAVYTGLPPGDYHFRVIACNNDGVWNEAGASFAFSVLPPFWQTWWFSGLLALGAMGLAGGAARYISLRKLRRELARLEQQHALETERTRIARDIHDDLGAGLTQISLLSDLACKHGAVREDAGEHFRQISQCAREIIRSMDAIVWAVNPKNDTLDHLANYLSQFAEDYLRPTGIRCRIDVPPVLPEVPLSAEIRHNIFLTVKEALHNAVKHSEGPEVWIRLAVHGRTVAIEVEDNGRGFAPSETQAVSFCAGNGLSNMKKRLEEIGGELDVRSVPGKGTRVILTLRLEQSMDGAE